SGADDFTIHSTHVGTTVLNTLGGADRVAVKATSGNTTVNTGDQDDTINVGSAATPAALNSGNLNGIQGALTVNGENGTNALNLDDTADLAANICSLTNTRVSGLGMGA